VTGADGNFNCSICIQHQWESGAPTGADADQAAGGSGVRAGRPFTAQIYEIGPAISLQNLLAADVDVRLCERTAARTEVVHWSSSIPRGDKRPVHLMISTQPTFIQLRIPSLQTKWDLEWSSKPAAGAAGFASQTLTGIGNTADYLTDNKVRPRTLRPQRFISPAVGLEAFDLQRAQRHEDQQRAAIKAKRRGRA